MAPRDDMTCSELNLVLYCGFESRKSFVCSEHLHGMLELRLVTCNELRKTKVGKKLGCEILVRSKQVLVNVLAVKQIII
jgi:hypothetical protein